jgi:ATP-dependent Clp protease protease subunit
LSSVEKALERDTYLSPNEAQDFGLIDQVVDKRPDLDENNGDKDSVKG